MSDTYRVLVTDAVSESGLAPLLEDDRFAVTRVDDSSTPEFMEALASAEALVVRSATRVDRDLISKGPRLRVIGRAGVGVDNIDLTAATEQGIAVMNSPAGNTISAAELTMALILAAARRVAEADQSMRVGKWDRSRLKGVELKGRTLGLVGAGRIGSEVAQRCRAFGMSVLAYDPYVTRERAEELGLTLADLDQVLSKADVISLHVPLSDDTRHLIDADSIDRMKPGAFLVNVSRGGVVDEDALATALAAGRLAGAALDVYESEPLQEDSPLRGLANLVLTPHLGASTVEAQELVSREIAVGIREALASGDLSRSVNVPVISGRVMTDLAPLFDLGRRLGRIAGVLAKGGLESVEVRYRGESDDAQEPLLRFVLVGLLENILVPDAVNFVSATYLAEQRGIGLATSRRQQRSDYPEFVDVRVSSDDGELRIAGALLGPGHPRLVRINRFRLDTLPRGTMVVLEHRDTEGVFAGVAAALEADGLGVIGYQRARTKSGEGGFTVVSVEGEPGADLRSSLASVPGVESVWTVELD